ncbi:Oidioi.mRNA.OKI2018_I69.chr2.g5745.t1.cds [Oikopleura dioica]|uniref:Oidioi.mRNA.OKI2018_I69.chr2.g5745.t1.cds n=1 Tax=Oikopleura dioica TaxID=34765 RepID=A0ABN7T4H2_OIKDI|nr:Oidioi.mRNA.OKI2018_I69.chr2.g5745.t1.cds [Oikopleura dioica]
MEVGRPSSFEVKLNDELLFSKYETTGFPIVDEILEQVEKAVKGEEVAKVTTSAPPVDMGNFFIILIAIALYLYGKPLIQLVQSLFS